MGIALTVLACLIVWAVQSWVLPLLVGMPLILLTGAPSRLVWRTVPLSVGADMERYAAEHPWRIHLAALLFRWGCVANAVISWALFLLLLYFLSVHVSVVNWEWVYIVSFLVFISSLNNARTLNSQANSLSFRLRGGTSELRYQHGQRNLPADEILGPIPVRRNGF